MCSVIILRRPGHPWPLLIAANRDEMRDRPWLVPAMHWPDRPDVIGGLDELAGGTWMALNEHGLMAALLNRMNTLGAQEGKRSRGELVLEALDHADASEAVQALIDLNTSAYRSFNMVVADNRDAFWVRSFGEGDVEVIPLPEGVSMITAFDLNDLSDPRIAAFLPRFQTAALPDPEKEESWSSWQSLLAEGVVNDHAALWIDTDWGFGTVCSSLLALPAPGRDEKPVWLFSKERGKDFFSVM